MKKESVINIRVPVVLKQHIKNIVKADKTVKNVSNFMIEAIQNHLAIKYGVTIADEPIEINAENLELIENFVPQEKQEDLKKIFMKGPAEAIALLDNYVIKTFLDGPEEILASQKDLDPKIGQLIEHQNQSIDPLINETEIDR
ncbi:MAG: hypothetical protein ACXAD7_22660 [Candidatus Kariarchaeaceae archaeon]|jgi:hypothetical protein